MHVLLHPARLCYLHLDDVDLGAGTASSTRVYIAGGDPVAPLCTCSGSRAGTRPVTGWLAG